MRRKTLYLMCGVPGSGKSTWVKNQLNKYPYSVHISRDEIRFSIVKENEDYFSQEKLVFQEFIRYIKEAFLLYDNVFVDATHLNETSRNKVLNQLDLTDIDIIPVNFEVPLETCLNRNLLREGRSIVPDTVIRNMYKSFRPATVNEKYNYKEVWSIK